MFIVGAAGFGAASSGSIFAKDQTTASVGNDPNLTCASCHRQIYERYRETPMANASGEVSAENLFPADFTHSPSGVHYRVFAEDHRVWLSYDREHAPASRALHGRQHLQYVIGSGKRGKTFLFEQEGYWLEAPINWYEKKGVWDMTPNYLSAEEISAGNLALIEAQQHHYEEAIHLWETVFTHDPVQLAAGMNLAIVDCGEGKKTEALETLDRLLTFSPDDQKARSLAMKIRSGSEHCGRKN